MKGEKSDILRVKQVFFKSEIVFIGLPSIKISPMEMRLVFIPYGFQNPKKKKEERKTEEEGEREGGFEREPGKSPRKLPAASSSCFTVLPTNSIFSTRKDSKPYFGLSLIVLNPCLFLKYLVREESHELVQLAPHHLRNFPPGNRTQ